MRGQRGRAGRKCRTGKCATKFISSVKLKNTKNHSQHHYLMACSHHRRGRDKLETRQNSLVLSAVVFIPPTRQDKTVLSGLIVTCSHRQRGLVKTGSRRDKTVLFRRVGGVNKPLDSIKYCLNIVEISQLGIAKDK